MDLNFGSEYTDFRKEVNDFCKEYSGVLLESSKIPLSDESSSGQIKMKRSDWQKLLIKKGVSASEFSKKINVQRSSISHIINGRNKPSLEIVTCF